MFAGIGAHPTLPPWLSMLGVVLGILLLPAIHTEYGRGAGFTRARVAVIVTAGVWHGLLIWQHQYALWGLAVLACVLLYAIWWIEEDTTPLGRTQDDELWAPYCFLCLRLAQAIVQQVHARPYTFLDNIRDEMRVALGWTASQRKRIAAAAGRIDDRDRYAYTVRRDLLTYVSAMGDAHAFSPLDREHAIVLARRVLDERARWVLTEEDNR
jgi:hypothetical protein